MSDKINIAGLDQAAVLAALYNASHQQGMGFMHARGARDMTVEEAREEITQRGDLPYFDYLHGRVMKIGLGRDELDPWLYDRDNGQGAAARALAPLLDQKALAA